MSLLKHFFPRNEAFNYQALHAAAFANYSGADVGEVIEVCSQIKSGDENGWLVAWKRAANRAVEYAETSLKLSNTVSAKEGFLRASTYYNTAEFFRRDDPFNDEEAKQLSGLGWETFAKAMRLTEYAFEEITVPYEETALPGYFLKTDKSAGKRPTIIFNGGYDSSKEEAWPAIAAAALARGYNVLAFDGPGQGMALRSQRLFFRPDWENVLTPVIDYTLKRDDVQADKIVIFGYSMGAYLTARAATVEHRAAALIFDDGVYDFGSAFRKQQPKIGQYLLHQRYDTIINTATAAMMRLSTGNRWGLLNGQWTFGVASPAEFLRKVDAYTLEGVVDKIVTPVLILDAQDDHFLKGQPEILHKHLTCDKKLVVMRSDEGAGAHCHMGAFARCHQVIFDYLAEKLAYTQDSQSINAKL